MKVMYDRVCDLELLALNLISCLNKGCIVLYCIVLYCIVLYCIVLRNGTTVGQTVA